MNFFFVTFTSSHHFCTIRFNLGNILEFIARHTKRRYTAADSETFSNCCVIFCMECWSLRWVSILSLLLLKHLPGRKLNKNFPVSPAWFTVNEFPTSDHHFFAAPPSLISALCWRKHKRNSDWWKSEKQESEILIEFTKHRGRHHRWYKAFIELLLGVLPSLALAVHINICEQWEK